VSSNAIDLRSDTVTKPTAAMRRAMAEADVGDDERDGDPTTQKLERRVAELLGKEAALFFPSGVMANQAAIWLFAARGSEVMLDVDAHIVEGEIAGVAALSGAQVFPVHGTGGVMTAADLRRDMRPPSRYSPMPSMVCVENTHNTAGGRIISVAELKAIHAVAAERTLPVHMDGARLWNASVASGVSLADFAACAETVMVAFSKGSARRLEPPLPGHGPTWSERGRRASCSAARCDNRAFSRRRRCTASTIISSGSPSIMTMPRRWRESSAGLAECAWFNRTRTS